MNKISSTEELYAGYVKEMSAIADIKYAAAVLQWDQETYLPEKGAAFRGQQIATLSEIAHSQFTSKKLGDLLNALLEKDLAEKQKRNIELTVEDYQKQKKLSPAFVRKLSETVSASFHAWLQARRQNEFSIFKPHLEKLVELKIQQTDMLGYEQHPYNALMDEFEKGATVKMLDDVFEDVKKPLQQLLQKVKKLAPVDDSFLRRRFPRDKQWEWGLYLASQLGFDYSAGRQDISEHPFTTNFSSQDVRITTRIDEHDFSNMTWSTIHEVGHALYEQGLPAEMYGLPLGEYTSLGIHESQSRIWENCVGRGLDFWQYYLPKLKEYFPSQLEDVSTDTFVKAINKVQPSLIRTEADELTYHFHVMIRYELEKRLIEKSLEVKDLPAYWNDSYEQMLGIKVPDDKHGCLQDVHWSHGSFGYFATYSLGSFYAAQFWQHATDKIEDLQTDMQQKGETKHLLKWLRENVHIHGRRFTSEEICILATGKKLDSTIFIKYLEEKLFQ